MSLLLGIATGVGAVVFRGLIALFHNALFLGRLSWSYDASVHTPASPWGAAVILVPVAASFLITLLVTRFAPEARGHGVPEVIEAIYHRKGVIRPVVAVVKSLASALSIGSGGSVGREGPIAQIGSAIGSDVGQILNLSHDQRVTLVAAGAAAGIAATFNTPVGGALFAVEILLNEVSASTLVPVTLAAATAAFVGQLAFGSAPSFSIPGSLSALPARSGLVLLPLYAGLGVVLAGASAAYIKGLYFTEDLFERIGNPYLRHSIGMAMIGASMYLLFRTLGHYYIEGVGYATVQDILSARLDAIWLLLLLCALKLLATSITLGSGASGGIFSPALFIGSTLGASYALAVHALCPSLPIDPKAFAIAGMAGLVGGSTGAAMTAIVMTLEMTLDYQVVLPMAVTVALSYGLRKMMLSDSIYTMKLTRRGLAVPQALRAAIGSPGGGS
jgi:CIC family chloride channel protein